MVCERSRVDKNCQRQADDHGGTKSFELSKGLAGGCFARRLQSSGSRDLREACQQLQAVAQVAEQAAPR